MNPAASVLLGDGQQVLAAGLLRRAGARAIDSAVIGASLFVAFWFGFFSRPVGDVIVGTIRTDPETIDPVPDPLGFVCGGYCDLARGAAV